MGKLKQATPTSVDQDTSLMSPKQKDEFKNKRNEDMQTMRRRQQIELIFMEMMGVLNKQCTLEKRYISPGHKKYPDTWPHFPIHDVQLPSSQFLTQDQMCEICNIIRDKKFNIEEFEVDDYDNFWAEVNLASKELYWERYCSTYKLRGVVITIKFIIDKTRYSFFMSRKDRIKAIILVGNHDGNNRAFITIPWVDGKEHIFELEEFSVLSVTTEMRDGGYMGVFATFN